MDDVVRLLKDPFKSYDTLTERERQVARLAGMNYSGREIAAILKISVPMAAMHLRFALAKMGVRRKGDLTRMLLKMVQEVASP